MNASILTGGAFVAPRAFLRRAGLAAFLAVFALGASLSAPRADEAKLPPMPKPLEELAADKTAAPPQSASMEAWGRSHPDCLEWTDNCQVCVAGDKPGCSTVGTACVRAAPVCRKSRIVKRPDPAPEPTPRPQSPAPETAPAAAPAPKP